MSEKGNKEDVLEKLRALIDRQDLDCSECRQPFRDPRILQCGHIFCFDCIETHISTYGNQTGFSCPKCSTVHAAPVGGTSKLHKGVFVNALLEAKNILHDGTPIRCTSCDRNRASHACLTCSAFLCKSCNDRHAHNQSDGIKHETCSLTNLRQPETFMNFQQSRYHPCVFHPNMKSTLFCKYDERRLCEECAKDEVHKGHFILGLREKLDIDISELTAKITQGEDERKQLNKSTVLLRGKEKSLELNANTVCAEIDKKVQELCRKVKEYGQRLKSEVNDRAGSQIAVLKQMYGKYKNELDGRQKNVEEIEVLPCMPTHSVLDIFRDLQSRTDGCKSLPSILPEELEHKYPETGFIASTTPDALLVTSLQSLVGFISTQGRKGRKCNKPVSDMPKDMQVDATESIHAALDTILNREHRTNTYTTISRKVCEFFKSKYNGKFWQCIVGTPGQLGYNIACSKDNFFNMVADGIEVTLFAPKLKN